MNSHTVTDILKECHRCVEEGAAEGSVEALQEFAKCKDILSDELVILLQEAADMKWPFVPEKWQYKHSLTSKDKVNLKDLISENLSQLLAYLKAAILAVQPLWAASAIFLVDRFLYWTDDSHQLLKIARKLHQRYPGTPIAPQVIIRQARVYFSTGKLQKAEYILGNLINNSGSTGCWRYHTESDRTLVQTVSVQVRGQVLQKLGLWFEAAELICASLVGFYSLPQPDKKGIGTSLGILANILVSMHDKDFHRFGTSEDIYKSFLGKKQNRLLSAAEAAKMAVIYSQYASLYVLTNVVTQGTCLLSYSFSAQCPPSEKATYLTLAKEAFEIGLLTKTEEDVVTSKQELHTFVKAAFALAITHKWLGSHYGLVAEATMICQEASKIYYTYCFEKSANKEKLCGEIMGLVQKVKSLLNVEPFVNSDPGSFIPDAYRVSEDRTVVFTPDDFDRVMKKFQQHHKSVCEASKASCHRHDSAKLATSSGVCVTSFGTATEIANTECITQWQPDQGPPGVQQEVKNDMTPSNVSPRPSGHLPGNQGGVGTATSNEFLSPSGEGYKPLDREKEVTFSPSSPSSSFGSSWANITSVSRSSNQTPVDSSSEADSLLLGFSAASIAKQGSSNKEKSIDNAADSHLSSQLTSQVKPGCNKSHHPTLSRQRTPKTIPDQSSIETEEEETDMQNSNIHVVKGISKEMSMSNSLSSSFGSLSSWPKAPSMDSENIPESGQTPPKSKKTIPDQSSIETEEDADFTTLPSQGSLKFKGAAQSNQDKSCSSSLNSSVGSMSSWQKVPSLPSFSSSLSSSFGASSSWLKVPSLDTGSFNSGSGLTGRHKGVPVNIKVEGPPGELCEVAKCPVPPVIHNTKPGYGSPQKSSMDSAETEGDILDPPPNPAFTQDITEPKIGISTKNGQRSTGEVICKKCFPSHLVEMGVLNNILTRRDYSAILAGVCHDCLMDRLPKEKILSVPLNKAYGALLLKFSKSTGLWTGRETNIYIGDYLKRGKQREAFQVQFLHQEELLGSYVGKQYYSFEVTIHDHLNDVERQMTAQYYVTEFNKKLYEKSITAQIFFIPSEVLLILEADAIIGCVTAEPHMLGAFSKLTNNTTKVIREFKAFEYGIAFGHFAYETSGGKEVVVDLQGWVTEDGKGLTYLTDPQIHTLWKPQSKTSNFHQRGINLFLEEQHGPECNEVCKLLCLGELQMPKYVLC